MKKRTVVLIVQGACLIVASILSFIILNSRELLTVNGDLQYVTIIECVLWFHVLLSLLCNILVSHKYAEGKLQEVIFFGSSTFSIGFILSYILVSLMDCNFDFNHVDWVGSLIKIFTFKIILFFPILLVMMILYTIFYGTCIDRNIFKLFQSSGLRGEGKLKQLHGSNLEDSRWMNTEEKNKVFKSHKYSQLANVKKDGIPVSAVMTSNGKDMDVMFNSPCHSIIIGSTGSGKTTTFVSPMIQLIGATSAGSSMVVTDPKGELFGLHSKYLIERGYDVKVCDLRDTYSSSRWNPLDSIWDAYQKYADAPNQASLRKDSLEDSGCEHTEPLEAFGDSWYEFNNKAYTNYDKLIEAVKIFRKKAFDEMYEDLNDLVSILIPIQNEKDPMWEKGARSIVFAVLLAMLEDSEDPELHMTKDKFNFFNMAKVLQNSTNDYEELRNYFNGRRELSKALALSKQVCDAATQTRASYMSIVYDKLAIFNDAGICALTSSSDIRSEWLAERPTALFLKIPDEKDTRHNLAAIFILNIYKTLIKVASATEELTLDRNVYFIMDEFGNMPKIEKFDKFITVGRSRKIWFTMIIQSYAQLNNVYGETVADIVKGNCGIKMFIGSNDMGTCKEYSELCGNITVVTTSTSSSGQSKDLSVSAQTQVRPLIYPSELQRLNHPGDIGHSIIVTFGNFPLKTYFSPSFVVPFYKMGKMDTSGMVDRLFDEAAVNYDISIRNKKTLDPDAYYASLKENQENAVEETEEVEETEGEDNYNDSYESLGDIRGESEVSDLPIENDQFSESFENYSEQNEFFDDSLETDEESTENNEEIPIVEEGALENIAELDEESVEDNIESIEDSIEVQEENVVNEDILDDSLETNEESTDAVEEIPTVEEETIDETIEESIDEIEENEENFEENSESLEEDINESNEDSSDVQEEGTIYENDENEEGGQDDEEEI